MKVRVKATNPLTNNDEIGYIYSLIETDKSIDPHKWALSSPQERERMEAVVEVKFRTRRVDDKVDLCIYQLFLSDLKPCLFDYMTPN